jgi:hypothetical protein
MANTGTRRPSRSRLAVLEAQHAKRKPPSDAPKPMAEEEWLATFQQMAAEGYYEPEPNYQDALAALEEAMANASANPRFFPPPHFSPDSPDAVRRSNWRSSVRQEFLTVDDTFMVLLEMSERALIRKKEAIRAD